MMLGPTASQPTTVTYTDDAFGRRLTRTETLAGTATTTHRFLYGTGRLPMAEEDATGRIERLYLYGTKAHVPVVAIDIASDGTKTSYRILSDHLGLVRRVVELTSGEVMQATDYDAWGNITSETLAAGFGPLPFGYAGGLHDRTTGLVRFGAREYDPRLGRWLQPDPIGFAGGDSNLYAYVGGNPVLYHDPSGRVSNSTLDSVAEFSAGVGDVLTMGIGGWARDRLGFGVNECSDAYENGSWAGEAADLLLGGGIKSGAKWGAKAAKNLLKNGCFASGALVLAEDGLVPIENVPLATPSGRSTRGRTSGRTTRSPRPSSPMTCRSSSSATSPPTARRVPSRSPKSTRSGSATSAGSPPQRSSPATSSSPHAAAGSASPAAPGSPPPARCTISRSMALTPTSSPLRTAGRGCGFITAAAFPLIRRSSSTSFVMLPVTLKIRSRIGDCFSAWPMIPRQRSETDSGTKFQLALLQMEPKFG